MMNVSELDVKPLRTKCLSRAIRSSQYDADLTFLLTPLPKRFDNDNKTINRLSKYKTQGLNLSDVTIEKRPSINNSKKKRTKPPSLGTNNPFKNDLSKSTSINKNKNESVSSPRIKELSVPNSPSINEKPLTEVSHYIIKRDIGQGTFGSVKLAEHKETKELVAIKVISKSSIKNPRAQARIEQEIKLLPLLKHPHIVKVYEVVEDEDRYMIIMEYLPSGELFHYILKNKRANEKEARYFFRQIISALDFCHQNSIVHRDIKPENLSFDKDMQIRLIDFGFATFFDPSSSLNTFCGSPYYASPEMIKGVDYIGPEIDIWSLGVTLFTMLSGKLPFNASNIKLFQKQVAKGEFEMPLYFSKEVQDLIRKMLSVDSKKRISMDKIRCHPWTNMGHSDMPNTFLTIRPPAVRNPNRHVLNELRLFGFDLEEAKLKLMSDQYKSSPVVNLYHLIEENKKGHKEPIRRQSKRESKKIILNGPNCDYYEKRASTYQNNRESRSFSNTNLVIQNKNLMVGQSINTAGRSYDSISRRSNIPAIDPVVTSPGRNEDDFDSQSIVTKEAKDGWFSGLFNVSATSSKTYPQIYQELIRVLTLYGCTFKELEDRFVCESKRFKVQFEVRIITKEHKDRSLVVFKNLKGSPWSHKKMGSKLIQRMFI